MEKLVPLVRPALFAFALARTLHAGHEPSNMDMAWIASEVTDALTKLAQRRNKRK